MPGHRDREERRVPHRHRLLHRPGSQHAPDAGSRPQLDALRPPGLRALRCERERQRRGRRRQWRCRLRDGRQLDGPFDQATSGFVGTTSDGLSELDASHGLAQLYKDAVNGDVVQTGRLALSPRANGSVTLALGFGRDATTAIASAEGSLNSNLDTVRGSYEVGWQAYDAGLSPPPHNISGLSEAAVHQLAGEYYLSANVIKASEDKTFSGAIVASLSSPWGQAVSAGDPNNTFFGSYRE